MDHQILTKPTANLAQDIQGVWWLLSRDDYNKNNERRIDPILGSDPIAILTYAKDHFAAQFMKRDRSTVVSTQMTNTGSNNTNAVGGYDAYFGKYEVDEETGKVKHTLIGSITPANIGMTVFRDLKVVDGKLTIQLETTTLDGEPILRTLIWERLS
jgi:lipocalin-like protein